MTVELVGAVRTRQNALPGDPRAAIASALTLTEDLWSRHGTVMKAAVNLSPTVSVIADLWSGARQEVVTSVRGIIAAAGVPDNDSPVGARALSAVLITMTERAFYDAAADGRSLAQTSATLNLIWLRSLRLDG